MILKPTYCYLDTAQWIGLSHGRLDAAAFMRTVGSLMIVPTLSFAHLSDLAEGTIAEERRRVGEFIDGVRRGGHIVWVKSLNALAADELQRMYERRHLKRNEVVQRSPFSSSMVDSMNFKDHGDPARLVAARREEDRLGVAGMIEVLRRSPRRPEYSQFRASLPATMSRVRESRVARKRFTPTEERELVAFVARNAHLQFSSDTDLARFLDDVLARRDDLPAIDLRLRFRQGELLTNADPSPSDAEDFDHLAGFAYCEVAFADKRTCDRLRRAGCRRLPRPNREFQRWLRRVVSDVTADVAPTRAPVTDAPTPD